MKRWQMTLASTAALMCVAILAWAQPWQDRQDTDRRAPRGFAPPEGRNRSGQGGQRRGGGARNPVIHALDANGDGEISGEEITRSTAALKALDRDGDGQLSRDELRSEDDGQAGGRRGTDRRAQRSEGPRPAAPGVGEVAPVAPRRKATGPFDGFMLIPGGEFEMGDHHDLGGREHRSDEVPAHKVRLDAFYMAVTETTNEMCVRFLNGVLAKRLLAVRRGLVYGSADGKVYCDTRESDSASGILWDGRAFAVASGRARHPVVCMRWEGAAACCNWLSIAKGLAPCYDLKTGMYDLSKNGYRLPTEAEWEYAGRGGRYGPYCVFPWGDQPDTARANWPGSGDPFEAGPYPWTTPVGFYDGSLRRKTDFAWPGRQGTYQTMSGANGYGLHDMSGNVWEWVNDWYRRDYYGSSPAANPPGPKTGQPMRDDKPYRVLRSGSWYNGQWGHGRVANRNPSYYRGPDDPDHRWYHIGFRLARNAEAGAASANVASTTPAAVKPPAPAGTAVMARTPGTRTVGLFLNTPKAQPGYTLFAPKHNTVTYLLDNQGRIVNQWQSKYEPGQSVYLLPNGHLLHCCFTRNKGFTRGGEGGRLEEFDWEGNLVWEFEYSNDEHLSHHDIEPLPNGNVLILAVEKKSYDECVAAGFTPRLLRDRQLFPEHIIEVQPTRPKGGKIVWEWHVWDHLIQDNDRTKANYGKPSEHPGRIDVDCNGRGAPAFWNHANSIAYNATLDQIVLSARGCNEIWVIDHSTTTKQAAGRTGGRGGKGGDLLYRWGNPAAYGRGSSRERRLFQQHDAQWIPQGYPGAGHIAIFNNGLDRGWSTVVEIAPSVDAQGRYAVEPGQAYGPARPVWTYQAKSPKDFFSSEISGAHRLPNGNTLVCAGVTGELFEVTREGEPVWRYVNPMVRGGILAQGEVAGKDHRGHSWNAVFKVHRYAPDYPGLKGWDLRPQGVIELPAAQKGKTGLDGKSVPMDDRFRQRNDDRQGSGQGRGGGRGGDRRSPDDRDPRGGDQDRRPPRPGEDRPRRQQDNRRD